MQKMNTHSIATVGGRIVEARLAKDMTQQDLAKRLGISRAAVAQWEINSTSPSIAKLGEVAVILGVEPQWLAYSSRSGETRVVYRNPERDNIIWIDELKFGDSPEALEESDKWGVPAEYLTHEINSSLEHSVICTINSHSVEPAYEYNDKVIIDRSDRKPSPAGTFLFWDGIGFAFARMQALPGKDPTVRITQKGAETFDLPLDDIQIIGRVKARFQRG